jgi:hypothetical protein
MTEGLLGPKRIIGLPPEERSLDVSVGDSLLLTRSLEPGQPAERSASTKLQTPGHISCTLSAVFDHCRPGLLARMQGHQRKKSPTMRMLNVSRLIEDQLEDSLPTNRRVRKSGQEPRRKLGRAAARLGERAVTAAT